MRGTITGTITFGEVLRTSSVLELLTSIRHSFFWGTTDMTWDLADFWSDEDYPVAITEMIPVP